jgi:hypothetical protein
MRCIALALLLAWPAAGVAAEPLWRAESADCSAAIATAERSGGIPAGLLAAIGHVESGRMDPASGSVRSWPWTINAEGTGRFFATKPEAVAAVTALRARGVASIDVGCMQVNLMHHPAAFATLEEAFDPVANALYAARFLNVLFSGAGDWPAAAAAYLSQTREIGAAYKEKVLAAWTQPGPAPLPAAAPRFREFAVPEQVAVAAPEGREWPAFEPKAPLPVAPGPAAGSRWVERVIGGIAACSQPVSWEPAAGNASARGAAAWQAAGNCPSSPFAKPATLRQVLAQP